MRSIAGASRKKRSPVIGYSPCVGLCAGPFEFSHFIFSSSSKVAIVIPIKQMKKLRLSQVMPHFPGSQITLIPGLSDCKIPNFQKP